MGDCVANSIRWVGLGPGTMTINTSNGYGGCEPYNLHVYLKRLIGDTEVIFWTGEVERGASITVPVPDDGICDYFVQLVDDIPSGEGNPNYGCGSKIGFTSAVWVSG